MTFEELVAADRAAEAAREAGDVAAWRAAAQTLIVGLAETGDPDRVGLEMRVKTAARRGEA